MKSLVEALINNKNMSQTVKNKTSFKKKDLEFGTVVMLRDDLYGVYIPKEKIDILKKYIKDVKDEDVFLTDSRAYSLGISYNLLSDYDENLKYPKTDDYDVVRVYKDLIPEDELNDKFVFSYMEAIRDWTHDKKYIERK